MPYYYGFPTEAKKPAATTVTISGTTYQPAQPSKIKVFAMQSAMSVLTSAYSTILALLVIVISYPRGTYIEYTSEGEDPRVPDKRLPFTLPGLAFSLKSGFVIGEDIESNLAARGFTTIKFGKQTAYAKTNATKEDFIYVEENVDGVDENCRTPNRFLNLYGFKGVLILLNLTTQICRALHHCCIGNAEDLHEKGETILDSTDIEGAETVYSQKKLDVPVVNIGEITAKGLKKATDDALKIGQTEFVKFLQSIVFIRPTGLLNYCTPTAVINPFSEVSSGWIESGSGLDNPPHGIVFKFHPALCQPDVNLITDVLGRHFMRILGPDQEEQAEVFSWLKQSISTIALTRLGDELTHLYKSIEIAIDCRAGCVPFFSGTTYEGTVMMGGEGCLLSVPGSRALLKFLPSKDLSVDFKNCSTHGSALRDISNLFPEIARPAVLAVTSMVGLRRLCLEHAFSADVMNTIVGRAADLTFATGLPWLVNPGNIKKSMSIIAGTRPLDAETPIARTTLFSNDRVLLGLSVFGEKTAPSWNVPSGMVCSLMKSPPVPPQAGSAAGSSKSGVVSDAGWVMTVRKTDLVHAVEDFRAMVGIKGYRSVPTTLAKKQGYFSFGRERMSEFWSEMQTAYRVVDPNFIVQGGEAVTVASGKRANRLSEETGPVSKRKKF